ncbi:hypothetical protein IAR55_003348 [Kwoniella newhampshirensis]|uniref:RING-type domain-containing protein n=1 Tax=Kwoniella newhampshirensis TaxID=1651941 RepID=A0AAW0YZC9_9TREE
MSRTGRRSSTPLTPLPALGTAGPSSSSAPLSPASAPAAAAAAPAVLADGSGFRRGLGPRRRLLDVLGVDRGDERGLREVLNDRRMLREAGQPLRPQAPPFVPLELRRRRPQEGARRRTIVEVDSDSNSDSSDRSWSVDDGPPVRYPDSLDSSDSDGESDDDDDYDPPYRVEGDDGNGNGNEERRVRLDDLFGSGSEDGESDDDFEITGVNINPDPVPARPRRHHSPPNRRLPDREFERAMAAVDQRVAEARAQVNEIAAAEAEERRRQIFSPPPVLPAPEPRPRIGLGGGVMVRGDRLFNFIPRPGGEGVARRHTQPAQDDAPQHNQPNNNDGVINWGRVGRYRAMDVLGAMGGDVLAGFGFGDILGMMGGAGPAGMREENVQTILSRVEPPVYENVEPGFTQSFDLDEIDSEFKAQSREPIEIDEDGNVIPRKGRKFQKSYLVCASCTDPLLVSSAYRSPEDRVWMLRCGHLIDQKCLNKLSIPTTEKELARVDKHPDVLGGIEAAEEVLLPSKSRRAKQPRAAKRAKKTVEVERRPDEYTWRCEVECCGMEHKSEEVGGVWKGVEGEGAVAVYA